MAGVCLWECFEFGIERQGGRRYLRAMRNILSAKTEKAQSSAPVTGQTLSTGSGLHFPGRTVLYVSEVAQKLDVTEQHILNLIEEGRLTALNVGTTNGRKFWRIPVESWAAYLKANATPTRPVIVDFVIAYGEALKALD